MSRTAPPTPTPPMPSRIVRPMNFDDRLRVETLTAFEQGQPERGADPLADQAGKATDGDLEAKLIARARAHSAAQPLEEALGHVRQAVRLVVTIGIVLAGLAGAAAARATLGVPRDEPVNFYLVLVSLLGVQTLLLLLWLALIIWSSNPFSRATTSPWQITLGGLALRAGQTVAGWIHKGPHHAAAISTYGSIILRGPIARWTLSSISHALWLAFNVGCIASVMVLLSARQYTFSWETTILSADVYVPLTQSIAALPNAAGFITPSRQQIEDSQWQGVPLGTQASAAWSSLLVGSLVLYGFAPRLLLLGLSLGQRRAARSRFRIDLSRPEYLRLRQRLMPDVHETGIVDHDDEFAYSPPPPESPRSARPLGPPAIVGVEVALSPNAASWPPTVQAVNWFDLGLVDNRADQRRVLRLLRESATEPSRLIVVCALTTTPDRGIASFLAEIRSALARTPAIVLTGGEALRQRTSIEGLERRIEDWRQMVSSAGVDSSDVIEVDLDHFTHASAARIGALVAGAGPAPVSATRHIEQAFDLIASRIETSMSAEGKVSDRARIELHRQIARLYRDDAVSSWRTLIAAPSSLTGNVADHLKTSAARVTNLLPAHLRLNPRWLAAGAAAGALGCIAAATLLSPVAIGALPMWSAIGAGLAQVMKSFRPEPDAQVADRIDGESLGEIIRAAALFTILLELQGRPESDITRILARIASADDEPAPIDDPAPSAAAIRQWLNDLRHRFDLALAPERSP